MITLKAEIKDASVKNDALRTEGKVPAVYYGPKEDSTAIVIDEAVFMKAYKEAGTSTIITLNDGKEEHDALIRDIQFHAVNGKPLHVDFYVIERGKKLTLNVPLEFIGEAPGEKAGGVLVKVAHEIEIEAMPRHLPSNIEIDISTLDDIDSNIQAGDIKLPEGVELKTSPEETLVLIQAVKEEEEEVPEFDPEAVEVEEKGKKEEESEEKTEE